MKYFEVSWGELQHLKAVSMPASYSVVISMNSCGKLQDTVYILKAQRPQEQQSL